MTAYERGQCDHTEGVPRSQNPFAKRTKAFRDWLKGWKDNERETEVTWAYITQA